MRVSRRRWRPRNDAPLEPERERRLRRTLAICCARRRRTLRNNLRAVLEGETAVDRLLARVDLDGRLRAEQVETEGFLRLADALEPRSD